MVDQAPIRLTQTVKKGGCAAKVAAAELREILARVDFPALPQQASIHMGTFDDAAIYQLTPTSALVQTLDFFTPIVDTPRLFGRIAAANALSDVYAMGGDPITALAILAYPVGDFAPSVVIDILQGASDILKEARCPLVGGHTIDDETTKFGLSVTGLVHPDNVWSNDKAQPGDHLILTKPLGTGTLTAALKRGEISEDGMDECLASMMRLNAIKPLLGDNLLASIRAATDITGFGLAGHGLNMARASGVGLRIHTRALPVFHRALEFIEKGFLTKAHRSNRQYVADTCLMSSAEPHMQEIFFDPQTSGGLLLAVASESSAELLRRLAAAFPGASLIGEVVHSDVKSLQFV